MNYLLPSGVAARQQHRERALPSEIEVKLELSPEAVERVLQSDLLGTPDKVVRQVSTYYDTPDLALSGRGFTLRLRRTPDSLVQTVKATAKNASLFARSEWEAPLNGERPVIDHSTPLANEVGEDLDVAPLFDVDVERQVWNLEEAGSKVEAALDQGDVVAGERRMAILELELELKDGDQQALFTLARRLAGVAPFRFGVRTKAERGFLLGAAQPFVYKAETVALERDAKAVAAFQAIAASCFRHFRLNEDILLARRNAEALHQARVALRRLRSAFSLFRPLLRGQEAQRLKDELRWLAAVLGEARNLDVLLAKAEDADIRARLRAAREEAYDEAVRALDSDRARALMLDFCEWLHCGDDLTGQATETGDMPAAEFAAAALDRMRKKLKKHGRALAEIDDEHRHEARKDAKKLRYAAEFFGPLYGDKRAERRLKRFMAAMEALQDQLGALNDLATGPDVLLKHGLSDHPGIGTLLSRDDKSGLIDEAQAALDDVIDAKRFWR